MDGAFSVNSPIALGLTVASKLRPWGLKTDLALSVGNGHCADHDSPPSPGSPSSPLEPQSPSSRKWMFSIIDTFKDTLTAILSSPVMDGNRLHDLLTKSGFLDSMAKQVFRLDVKLPGTEPRLDAVELMGPLLSETQRQHARNPEVAQIADILITTMFYLELTDRPIRDKKGVSCQGRILCDLAPGRLLEHFITELEQRKAIFRIPGATIRIQKRLRQRLTTDVFQINMKFRARDHNDTFPITLQFNDGDIVKVHGISTSPFTLNQLLRAQGWANPFGRADHGLIGPEKMAKKRRRSERIQIQSKRRLL